MNTHIFNTAALIAASNRERASVVVNEDFYSYAKIIAQNYSRNRNSYATLNVHSEKSWDALIVAIAHNDRWSVAEHAMALLYHESFRDIREFLTVYEKHDGDAALNALSRRISAFVNEATMIASKEWLDRLNAFWIDIELNA